LLSCRPCEFRLGVRFTAIASIGAFLSVAEYWADSAIPGGKL
jgi:hypothetical protein